MMKFCVNCSHCVKTTKERLNREGHEGPLHEEMNLRLPTDSWQCWAPGAENYRDPVTGQWPGCLAVRSKACGEAASWHKERGGA